MWTHLLSTLDWDVDPKRMESGTYETSPVPRCGGLLLDVFFHPWKFHPPACTHTHLCAVSFPSRCLRKQQCHGENRFVPVRSVSPPLPSPIYVRSHPSAPQPSSLERERLMCRRRHLPPLTTRLRAGVRAVITGHGTPAPPWRWKQWSLWCRLAVPRSSPLPPAWLWWLKGTTWRFLDAARALTFMVWGITTGGRG